MSVHGPADLPYVVWGRPVKPLALAASVAVFGVALGPFTPGGNQVFEFSSGMGYVQAVTGLVTLILFQLGWWLCYQRLVEWGLLLTAGVFCSRAVLGALTVGFLHPAVWISVGMSVGAAGAWTLERAPRRRRE